MWSGDETVAASIARGQKATRWLIDVVVLSALTALLTLVIIDSHAAANLASSARDIDAGYICMHPSGNDGCVCGFRSSAPKGEWTGYAQDCSFFDDFCAYDCCPPGQQINPGDPTSCIPLSGKPTFAWFGMYPDFMDASSRHRLRWTAFGATSCTVTAAIDGVTIPPKRYQGSVGTAEYDLLVTGWNTREVKATAVCANDFGSASSSLYIPQSEKRLRVEQNDLFCWELFPYFFSTKRPYAGGSCILDVCAGSTASDPCKVRLLTQKLDTASGCMRVPLGASPKAAFVRCETGNVQRELYSITIP